MKTNAAAYTIHVDGEHGTFFVRSGVNRLTNTWLELTINSTFGTFGHTFGSIGGTPAEFLADVEFDYLMGKLMGVRSSVFDLPKAERNVRELIAERRRQGDLTREEARELWGVVDSAVDDCCGNEVAFFASLASDPTLYDLEISGVSATVRNPKAVGFWEKLWPPFIAELTADARAVAA